MTTIEFGGGPSIEARRQFSNLKDGSQVPKYTGHIHQLRYRHGHTYGNETHRLGKEFPDLIHSKPDIPIVKIDQSDPYETREFPDGMLPGYTGYIPQRKFQLGNRYRVDTDVCLSGTKATYEEAKNKSKELRNTIASYPKTKSLNSETVVKHFLDFHRAYNPTESSQTSDRRVFVEPPIPGYRGYIPRIRPTDIGLGLRYHEATKKGLNRFVLEATSLTTNYPTSIDLPSELNLPPTSPKVVQRSVTSFSSHRLYAQSGMVPKYTGYLPQSKYHIGQTYGDTTRNLPICSHSFNNFGEYVRSKSSVDFNTHNDV
ncbi:unnamed protein product [Rotaria sp. Silwood2]|nr:unnamed protein product [Rotaria sp. Silwood2]CAF2703723.1 unnamed protein product [Rotaria sp. Silwood2]CAF3123799.1 unnamed protein product [Rotaria sp. Silwood2]CAF4343769.1 unnamed protein product [Rotaria sp. Silwood2]CAF4386299.1 unnamed protein product [Rotaria sp. Silwood2]